MVGDKQLKRYVKRQEMKEKLRLEKEEEERKRKEEEKRLSTENKLKKELAERFDEEFERKLLETKRLRKVREESRALKEILRPKPQEKEKSDINIPQKRPYISRKNEEKFKTRQSIELTEEEKEKCKKKTLEQLTDEIGSSTLVCPPGKEPEKKINERELTADLVCFRKRIRKKTPKEINAAYDKLLKSDPERLCK
jgi:hypothetical protein